MAENYEIKRKIAPEIDFDIFDLDALFIFQHRFYERLQFLKSFRGKI